MITLPELQDFVDVYGVHAEMECHILKNRYDYRVTQGTELNRQISGSLAVPRERFEVVVSDEMARDLTFYQERMSSVIQDYQRGSSSAGDVFGVVNELIAKLTGFRTFITQLPSSVTAEQRVKLDTRIVVEQERILRLGTEAVKRDGFEPIWGKSAYLLFEVSPKCHQ